MNAIILAAGYATRLAPLTDHCPKPLLPVRGVVILDYLISKILAVREVQEITIVSNHKFHGHFENWRIWSKPPIPCRILDDGSTTNENRLGAIADLKFALENGAGGADALVLAADNLFGANLNEMVTFARKRNGDSVIVRELNELALQQRTGIAVLDSQDRLTEFQEKPKQPKSNLAVPPIYVYRKSTLGQIATYLKEGNSPDSPGNLIAWLCSRTSVYGYRCNAQIFDIGNMEQYAQAQVAMDGKALASWGYESWRK